MILKNRVRENSIKWIFYVYFTFAKDTFKMFLFDYFNRQQFAKGQRSEEFFIAVISLFL